MPVKIVRRSLFVLYNYKNSSQGLHQERCFWLQFHEVNAHKSADDPKE